MPEEYVVTWEIDIDTATSPEDAARQALRIQRDAFSQATVFEVVDGKGVTHCIDLISETPEFDYWDEHEDYPLSDWIHEIKDNNTRMGYWDWIESMKESDI